MQAPPGVALCILAPCPESGTPCSSPCHLLRPWRQLCSVLGESAQPLAPALSAVPGQPSPGWQALSYPLPATLLFLNTVSSHLYFLLERSFPLYESYMLKSTNNIGPRVSFLTGEPAFHTTARAACVALQLLFPPRDTSERSPGVSAGRPWLLRRWVSTDPAPGMEVRSKEDGRLYAVKRSMSPFRGPKDRARKLAEVGSHEKVGQHPCCVRLEQAWEEGGILYLQTELCGPSLQQHCEAWGASLPEAQVWGYLRDTLLALAHLHGQGLVHLDVKPANIFLGPRGRCKLGDFGLLVELGTAGAGEVQEGDPRYMAPELLQGSYGTAADVFSLGLTILEVACNMELPHGGEGWQQLRQGYLPPEFTAGLSSELRSVLVMMLEPDPKLRATAEALLALPVLRQPRAWGVLWCMAAEALSRGWALWQALLALLCWLWHGLAHPASWLQPLGPPATPPGSPPCSLLLDSSLSSNWDDDSLGPSLSPEAVLARTVGSTSTPRSRCTPRDALDLSDINSEPPRGSFPSFEPRNLLSLFEDTLDPT
ncbi:membrane-associated tyrosine- and threonine-specific cdc2-inhibitory kinase isoform X1 [Gorilla gorilla gorilla]|uniref:membrane-associated tyrosine- and threonine-specific cdc2-inhibitory kinase isoform X1 n=1 Tax=Gorilla gorilla gorilla TaxID=9595 RepID=UPI002445CA4D|nr:membrane-associated tyrosine- and threonine-specific cdc2-inhibitory kinase isoform X1 [Gorilla gorilla gorilla]